MQGSSSFKAGGRYYSFQVNRKKEIGLRKL
jgi:hypothetical protein